MRHESFTVDGPVELVVRAPAGTVEIETADVSEATIELEPKDAGSAESSRRSDRRAAAWRPAS